VTGWRLVVDGRDVAAAEPADTYWQRLRGMLGRRALPDALVLAPGGSVHGWGMRVPLDVALLVPDEGADRRRGPFRVVRTAVLRPGGLVGSARGVRAVLESPQGRFDRWDLAPGSTVHVVPSATAQT
jgi:uncharacterized membrane protein (UPF0127 family)